MSFRVEQEVPEESALVAHARNEFDYIGDEEHVVAAYLDIIRIFESLGHSGGSAGFFIETLYILLRMKNLTPLTDSSDEWSYYDEEMWGESGGIWQNNRNSEAFSDDGGKTYRFLVTDPETVYTSASSATGAAE